MYGLGPSNGEAGGDLTGLEPCVVSKIVARTMLGTTKRKEG